MKNGIGFVVLMLLAGSFPSHGEEKKKSFQEVTEGMYCTSNPNIRDEPGLILEVCTDYDTQIDPKNATMVYRMIDGSQSVLEDDFGNVVDYKIEKDLTVKTCKRDGKDLEGCKEMEGQILKAVLVDETHLTEKLAQESKMWINIQLRPMGYISFPGVTSKPLKGWPETREFISMKKKVAGAEGKDPGSIALHDRVD